MYSEEYVKKNKWPMSEGVITSFVLLDGTYPNKQGMAILAEIAIKAMLKGSTL